MPIRSFICLSLLSMLILNASAQDKSVYKDPGFIKEILAKHNSYRSALGLQPLTWSATLATDALTWAQKLVKMGQGQHDRSIVGKEGENLWWGTADAYSYSDMVGFWGNEQKDFVYGTFPDVKKSRSAVVGHYTQMVWKNTTSVGCAIASDGKMDFLVCRYGPAGNVLGQKPY